jgi:hypothetical protein
MRSERIERVYLEAWRRGQMKLIEKWNVLVVLKIIINIDGF